MRRAAPTAAEARRPTTGAAGPLLLRRVLPLHLTASLLLAGELDLTWREPSGCPDAAAVAREVEAVLGRPLAPVRERPIVALGAIERRSGGAFVLTLEVRRDDAVDRRTFEAARCDALAEAAAVVLAVAIDPSRAVGSPALVTTPPAVSAPVEPAPSAPSSPPAPAVAPAPLLDDPPEPAPVPKARPDSEPRLSGLLRLGPALAVGLVPGVTGGATGGLSLVTPRLRLDLDGAWFAAREGDPGVPDADLRIRIGAATGGLRVCARPRLGPVEFPTCLGGQVGALLARGVGADIDAPIRTASPWAAASIGAGVRAPLLGGRLALLLRADALLVLARPRFGLAGLGAVYTAPSVAFQPALALEVRLP